MTIATATLLPAGATSLGCGPIRPTAPGIATPLRQQIFECVRSAGQISRIDVAKQLDVSPGTVSTLVADLMRGGLLREDEAPPTDRGGRGGTRGRPPVALSVRPEAGYVAGIKLSDAIHTGVITDFAGEPVAEASLVRTAHRTDTFRILEEAETLFERLLAAAGRKRTDILAVGLSLPGIIDHESGTMHWSPILREEDVELRAMAAARLGVPVEIDNDANLVTLAELWYGAGRTMSDFVVITIEHGVGMGLVINHQLYRGAHGIGMELGHTKVQLDGALCRCGQRGCLEAYVSDYALVREASTALDAPLGRADTAQVMLETLYEQAKAGNEAARTIFRRAGRFLAVGLANVVNLFDPSLIILSGERMRYDYLYATEVLAEMQALTLKTTRSPPKVEINAWGDLVWARGAATLALSHVTGPLANREVAA